MKSQAHIWRNKMKSSSMLTVYVCGQNGVSYPLWWRRRKNIKILMWRKIYDFEIQILCDSLLWLLFFSESFAHHFEWKSLSSFLTLDEVRFFATSSMVTNSYVLGMDAFKRQMIDCIFFSSPQLGFLTHFDCALWNNMKAFNARRESLERSIVMKIESSRKTFISY